MESCVFCKIIASEIPAAKVWENQQFLAFLSIAPINPGHTLLIPKKHLSYIFDLDQQTLSQLLPIAQPIAQALQKVFQPQTGKIGLMVAGGEVPHVHLHLIPMDSELDLNFERAKHDVSFEKLQQQASEIKQALKD